MSVGARPEKASIEWVDLSLDDVRQAKEFLQGLQDEGVLDELGFGILQSGIADQLYPATNTQMTRSRHLSAESSRLLKVREPICGHDEPLPLPVIQSRGPDADL